MSTHLKRRTIKALMCLIVTCSEQAESSRIQFSQLEAGNLGDQHNGKSTRKGRLEAFNIPDSLEGPDRVGPRKSLKPSNEWETEKQVDQKSSLGIASLVDEQGTTSGSKSMKELFYGNEGR